VKKEVTFGMCSDDSVEVNGREENRVERVKEGKANNFQAIEVKTWTIQTPRLVKSASLSDCNSPLWKIKGLPIIGQKKKNSDTKRKEQQIFFHSLIFQF